MPIGDYKRTVDSHVATTSKLAGMLAFGSTLMEPILAAAQPAVTLQAYVAMNEAQRRSYDLLYADKVVAIIMTNGCSYGSLKKWLAQNQLVAGVSAYTSISNDLVDMINSGTFAINASKQKQKKGKKKGEEKTLEPSLSQSMNRISLTPPPLNVTQRLMMTTQRVKISVHLMRLFFSR